MTKWDGRFYEMALLVSSWSKDPSTRVGAVIADDKNRVVSVGYNGPPRGTEDGPFDRATKLRRTIHAEANAIMFARRDLDGCSLYVTSHPCGPCAAKIAQAGIARVVCPEPSGDFADRWSEDVAEAKGIFKEAGITLVRFSVR